MILVISDTIWVAIITGVCTVILALLQLIGILVGLRNGRKSDAMHRAINGRMDQMLVQEKAAGVSQEKEDQHEREKDK